MAVDFAIVSSAVLSAFATSGFTYTPAGQAGAAITGIIATGEAAEAKVAKSWFTFWARLSDFPATPHKGDTLTVPSGIDGVPAGNYRVSDLTPVDAAGGLHLGFTYIRP